ncbi:FecR family protein [Chitinophaga sp. Mgbs1]|uniref:FecR family protein n=1 Tax=Chitinophaga solisilvae TaxID=1233460 RepID=A0A3S1CSC5_9BACT|nr:FecR family protein [Chitinophaga solisilvae]
MEKEEQAYANVTNVTRLIIAYLQNTLTAEESIELNEWISHDERNRILFVELVNDKGTEEAINYMLEVDKPSGLNGIMSRIGSETSIVRSKSGRWMYAAAAAMLILISAFTVLYFVSLESKVDLSVKPLSGKYNYDVKPNGYKATLTLGSGKQIRLGKGEDSSFVVDNNISVVKKNGVIMYDRNQNGIVTYNTLSTPVSGTFKVWLSDGTEVWLNAGSSLRYPTCFNGNERRVYLTGEGYFKVKRDENMPFVVNSPRSTVVVLGTSFNVTDYVGETKSITTLEDGLVKVSNGRRAKLLRPGNAAVTDAKEQIVIEATNVASAVGWKNGFFTFNNSDIDDVMKQIARWYDVRVKYSEGKAPPVHFTGDINRESSLSEVLKMLESTGGVKFSTADKTIIVLP